MCPHKGQVSALAGVSGSRSDLANNATSPYVEESKKSEESEEELDSDFYS